MEFITNAFEYLTTSNEPSSSTSDGVARAQKVRLLAKRDEHIGSKCQLFFANDPIVVERASMQYVYDSEGRRLLDCISNVQHVGHCHPKVVQAISEQLAKSTCNARFVSEKLTECAEELLKTLPGLDTIMFCNSGSEANDLALRLARDFTGHKDVVVLEHAYHGHITTTMQISPYKFEHGSSIKKPDWVHVTPVPDVYRGLYRLEDSHLHDANAQEAMGEKYASAVVDVVEDGERVGRHFAAFIAEALQSCGGQIVTPRGYLTRVGAIMRARGALMIIDEVQTGFGRVGTFWAHQMHNDGFTPDIVTMGKPMGNGFPVAAIATRKEIADRLGGIVGYFNTYGGNPVACAATLAVMSVLRDEHLVIHSQKMGKLFAEKLAVLCDKHACIGDIRGIGMFWGVDLVVIDVNGEKTREPATQLARTVIARMRAVHGVLLSADGPHSNVLKFKPPMCFNADDLHKAIGALDAVLCELAIFALVNHAKIDNELHDNEKFESNLTEKK